MRDDDRRRYQRNLQAEIDGAALYRALSALEDEAKGIAPDRDRVLGRQMIENVQTALDTLVRDERGIDPAELGGSAWVAAVTSFLFVAVGAIIPVLS